MATLDVSKSAFLNTRELVFKTLAIAESSCRAHAVKAVKALSKVAVPAVLLVLIAANVAFNLS